MPQIVTRVDQKLVRELDRLIDDGAVESRSDAVRKGLEALVERHRRTRTGLAIVEGYRRVPQAEVEIGWSEDATRRMIADEQW